LDGELGDIGWVTRSRVGEKVPRPVLETLVVREEEGRPVPQPVPEHDPVQPGLLTGVHTEFVQRWPQRRTSSRARGYVLLLPPCVRLLPPWQGRTYGVRGTFAPAAAPVPRDFGRVGRALGTGTMAWWDVGCERRVVDSTTRVVDTPGLAGDRAERR